MGDPFKGKQLYKNLWTSCHNLYGRKGNIAPELTGSNRTHVAYLLNDIMDPRDLVLNYYKLITFTTTDGRIYEGNVINEN